MDIGENIKRLRKSKGWSQYDLADKSGVLRQTINLIENGKVKKNVYEYVTAISKALEVSPNELVGEPIPKEKQEILDQLDQVENIIHNIKLKIRQS